MIIYYCYYVKTLHFLSQIEHEFNLIHPNRPVLAETFPCYADKILQIYKNTVQTPRNELLNSNECTFDSFMQSFLALLQMLTPTAKGKKACSRGSSSNLIPKLFIFKQVKANFFDAKSDVIYTYCFALQANITFPDALEQKCTTQPFLIMEGSSPAAIAVYHLFVDGKVITLPKGTTTLEAVDYLFMIHFVLKTEYDKDLKTFWLFIQSFFYGIDDVEFTAKMREVRSQLANVSECDS